MNNVKNSMIERLTQSIKSDFLKNFFIFYFSSICEEYFLFG